jgi:hypothetical protein
VSFYNKEEYLDTEKQEITSNSAYERGERRELAVGESSDLEET